jgi:AcrR family transcriptional regulator
MSTAYELSGRVGQKRRTRDALVEAARELVAAGLTPTVEAAAEAASISRTTAYRYFPNQRVLLVAAHPETGARSMLPADAPDDVAARLALVIEATTSRLVETEPQQRTMLRLSLEATPAERAELPLRQGRVIPWIEEALSPLRPDMSQADVHRLALAIRSATGVEALAWLTDVADLSRDDAVALMRWSASALLGAALADGVG